MADHAKQVAPFPTALSGVRGALPGMKWEMRSRETDIQRLWEKNRVGGNRTDPGSPNGSSDTSLRGTKPRIPAFYSLFSIAKLQENKMTTRAIKPGWLSITLLDEKFDCA
jgi:hypothetical protein